MGDWRSALADCLPRQAAALLRDLTQAQADALEEVRFRVGQPVELVMADERRIQPPVLDAAGMDELLCALCGYARYAREAQLAQGYLPLPGGHRAGVCGQMTRDEAGVLRMGAVTSVCIRVARAVRDASLPIRAHLLDASGRARRVLVLGQPGCGKTTVLRDAALYLAGVCALHVAVADEREELFPPGRWPQARLDVLSGAPKAAAMGMLVRAMAPQVLVTDELGGMADAAAVLDAAHSGVGLLASAHAADWADATGRPALALLLRQAAFERVLALGWHGTLRAAWDGEGRPLADAAQEGEKA